MEVIFAKWYNPPMPYIDQEKAKVRYLRRKLDGRANIAARKYVAAHPELVRARKKAWRDKRFATYLNIIKKYKLACVRCGYNEHAVALDFDHLDPSKKNFTIATAASLTTITEKLLLEEIAKCQVLCANCHRVKTHIG
jgi:ADP-heptose:LPS heptosyltransferase